jgi:hypothetical protein
MSRHLENKKKSIKKKMTKTYNTVGTGPKSNRIIVEGVKCCL